MYRSYDEVKAVIAIQTYIEFFKLDVDEMGVVDMEVDGDGSDSGLRVWGTPKDKSLASIPNIKYLSPQSLPLLYDIKVKDREEYVNLLLNDSRKIEELDSAVDDPDYYPDEYNLGVDMEKFISIYGSCPICRERTLRQFSKENMPVVDLICINPAHDIDMGPILWQVKASSSFSYFSNDGRNKYITVGSRNWGNSIHTNHVKEEKDFYLGYICLYVSIDEINRQYIIRENSFVVIPDTKRLDLPYYQYLNQDQKNSLPNLGGIPPRIKKNIITWYNCDVNQIVSSGMNLPLTIKLDELIIYNNIQILESIYLTKYLGIRRSQRLAKVTKKLFPGVGGSTKYKIEYTY